MLKEVKKAEEKFPSVKIISQDNRINEIKIQLVELANYRGAPINVLLRGEKGTGKELFANAIHESRDAASGKFISVDCSTITPTLFTSEFFGSKAGSHSAAKKDKPGLFLAANNGTLFLDEIGNMPIENQQKLLRVLQTREILPVGDTHSKRVDVMVVYASNKDLSGMVEKGTFLSDLLDRIECFKFEIPPLRVRPDDILPLVKHFVRKRDTEYKNNPKLTPLRVEDEVIEILKMYNWPGNVRQLENVLLNIIAFRGKNRTTISERDLPPKIIKNNRQKMSSNKIRLRNTDGLLYSDNDILLALEKCSNNRTHAAKDLGISLRQVFRRIEQMEAKGIKVPPARK